MTENGLGPETRVKSLRFPARLAREVEFVARMDGTTFSEFVRESVAGALKLRLADPKFQKRIETRVEADLVILERMAKAAGHD
jgi:hypothetical protein